MSGWAGEWVGRCWVGRRWVGGPWVGEPWVGEPWVGEPWVGEPWVVGWVGLGWVHCLMSLHVSCSSLRVICEGKHCRLSYILHEFTFLSHMVCKHMKMNISGWRQM